MESYVHIQSQGSILINLLYSHELKKLVPLLKAN